jgi:N-methylhydantoinase B/oxoprolinase/acetone carboxylase alpha subunit
MASIMNLHLEYRLWIADLNADINVLRILDDYLKELSQKKNSESILKSIENYKKQFSDLRKEIDELRHEMHINKMKLAASGKAQNELMDDIEKEIHHKEMKERYNTFRKNFDKTKNEFHQLVGG